MTEAEFWEVIATSRKKITTARSDQITYLVDYLSAQPEEEIFSFAAHFQTVYLKSYISPLWCVAYVAMGGCSDDGFDYFRAWLIAQGEEVFENAMQYPDSLVAAFDKIREENKNDYPSFELMLSVPLDAYIKKHNFTNHRIGMDEYYAKFDKVSTVRYPNLTLDWEEDNAESMKKICPKVFATYWEDPF